jgi:hypothetical protein
VSAADGQQVRCVVSHIATGRICPGFAVVEVLAGCVHEHLSTRRLCQQHVDGLVHGLLQCRPCLNGGAPHACELVPIVSHVIDLEGAAS